MNISIGSDHAGYDLKEKIKDYLHEKSKKNILNKILINDRGTYNNDSCDYPDYAHLVADDVVSKKSDFGILICGSGNGINMAANKHEGIRSALCWNKEVTELSRLHNNANIITLPARFISTEEAIEFLELFFSTQFERGRHTKRTNKININKNDE